MKKIISLVALAAIAMSLTACGKFKCDACQQEKTGKKYTEQGVTICKDCYDSLMELKNSLGNHNHQ